MICLAVNTEGPHAEKAKQNYAQPKGHIVTYGYDLKWVAIDPNDIHVGELIGMCLAELGSNIALTKRMAEVVYTKVYGDVFLRIDIRLGDDLTPENISKPVDKLVFYLA